MPGETLTISGVGFAASTVLGIGLFNPPMVLGTVASNGLGNYTATVTLPFGTPPGQNEITVFGKGSDNACVQSLGLFTVKAPPVPVTSPPVVVTPVFVTPVTVIGTGGVIQVVGTTPATIVVQQPLARTGSIVARPGRRRPPGHAPRLPRRPRRQPPPADRLGHAGWALEPG